MRAIDAVGRYVRSAPVSRHGPAGHDKLIAAGLIYLHLGMIDMRFKFRCLVLLLATFSLAFSTASAAEPNPLAIGDSMPSFDLPGVDGKNHSDAEYRDAKVLLILFTCNHCPTAQAYEDRIEKLEAEYRQRGVRLVAISPNDDQAVRLDELGYSDLGDSLEDMKLRAEDADFEFPYLYDGETQSVFRKNIEIIMHKKIYFIKYCF